MELMVTVLIIGIFSAVAIPGIIEIRYRNTLTDSVARVRSAAQAIRDLAVKTRRAAVLEVRSDKMWINLLDGPKCSDAVEKKCVGPLADRNGEILLYDADGLGSKAGVTLKFAVVLQMVTPEDADPACSATTIDLSQGFQGGALCYGGNGELYFRDGPDQTSQCSPPENAEAGDDFIAACNAPNIADVTFPDGEDVSVTDGVVIGLNRYEEGAPTDVLRLVYVPISGAPYSEIYQ